MGYSLKESDDSNVCIFTANKNKCVFYFKVELMFIILFSGFSQVDSFSGGDGCCRPTPAPSPRPTSSTNDPEFRNYSPHQEGTMTARRLVEFQFHVLFPSLLQPSYIQK
jgi:hypothetical protein